MVENNSISEVVSTRRRLRIVVPAFPAFNIYTHVACKTTALGPVCIASVVNKMPGWDVEIIDENNYRLYGPKADDGFADHRVLQELRRADVVGFYGGLSSTIPRLYEIAKLYKEMGVPTLAGGQHFIGENVDEGLSNGVDLILIGEGEYSIQECLDAFLEKADLGGIAGLAYLVDGKTHLTATRAPIENFEDFPIPDFSLVRYAKITLFPISRVRGCGMDCEFCTVKGKARYSSAERAMEQFMSAAERWRADYFFIVDDLFGQDRAQALRLCQLLKDYQEKIGRRFFITVQIRLDKSKDIELLTAMREAGVRAVCIGFESPIPQELSAMNKHLKPEDMVEMTSVFHKYGFLVHGMFIFGYPMRSGLSVDLSAKERVRYFRSFVRKAKIDTIQVLLPVPLPGTEMTDRLAAQGRLLSRDLLGWEYYDGNFPLFIPDSPMTPESMLWSVRKVMTMFYRFDKMFSVGFHTLSFPVIVFGIDNLHAAWRSWYKSWRNSVIRFTGWIILRNWMTQFRKGDFMERLSKAVQAKAGKAKI